MEWIKTAFKGVRYRISKTRKNGAVKEDQYFVLHYKLDGKVHDEPVGWASDGWNAEKAALELAKLKENRTKGGSKTLKESKEKHEAARKAEAVRKQAEAYASKTLADYWTETYLPAAKRSKKECSWEKEESHFRLWINPIMGTMPLKDINLAQWDELVNNLSADGKSQRTRLYVTGTLRRILKHAFDRRLVNDSPPSGKRIGVTSPGNNRRLRVISDNEEAAIMSELAIRDPRAWRITRFAFLTGCRASEAFNLVWANIDFTRKCMTFPETKNNDSRTLPLTKPLLDLFSSTKPGSSDAHVFPKDDGKPYTQAPSPFNTAVEKLELNEGRSKRDRVVFHSIRHTVATRLAPLLGLRELMEVMGWRTVQMAMRYVKSHEGTKARALSALGGPAKKGKVLQFPEQATKIAEPGTV